MRRFGWKWAAGGEARWELLKVLPKASWPFTAVVVVGVLAAAACSALFSVATGAVVGTLPAAVRDGWGSSAGHRLALGLGAAAALFFGQQVIAPVRQAAAQALGRRVNGRLRERVMAASLAPVGIGHLEDTETLDRVALAREVGPSGFSPGMAAMKLDQYWSSRMQGVAQAIVAARFSVPMALLVAAAWLSTRGEFRRQLLKTVNVVLGKAHELREANYVRDIAITPAAAKEVRVFGLAGWAVDRFRKASRDAMRGVWAERRRGQWRIAVVIAVVVVGEAIALISALDRALSGDLTLGQFTVYAMALMGIGSLANQGDDTLHLAYGTASVPAVVELEQAAARPDLNSGGDHDPTGLPRKAIRFEGVAFRYRGRDEDVYRSLDLEIPAGRSLAIVGANGAGKTTLVKLLTRLYDPTDGRITVDGVDVREFDPRLWQRRVGAIFQDFLRYDLTLAENVAAGAIEHLDDRAGLERAVERAGADRLLDELPLGWDTVLSRRYVEGADLSGGQWQRVALARALFAVDHGAGVLVLDEPTANLDVRAEVELFDRFLELTSGLTTILISHRFSTVRRAERIVVLDAGRVVEAGTHDDLVAAGGRYAQMFRLQSSRFTDA